MMKTIDAPLTAQDRCDRCGAQAKVTLLVEGAGTLLFCQHHANALLAGVQ
jgi:hypothetical protein